MKTMMKRLLSGLLCLALALSLMPVMEEPAQAATGYDRGYQGRMAGDGKIYAHGLDVSAWQESGLNFQNFANAGYTYVILRIGTSYGKDNCFEEYYNSAKAAGLNVGCYYYSYATSAAQAQSEAYSVLNWMNGKLFEYPVYFDYEDPSQSGISGYNNALICYAFMDIMKANGYLTGLYSMASWLEQDWVTTYGIRDTYEGWVAHIVNENANTGITSGVYNYYHSRYCSRYGMFQYSWDTWVNGAGPFDANVAYKDYPAIVQAFGFNGYYGFNLLDGHEPIDLGKDFYAYVRQPSTGRYMTHKNGNVYVRHGLDDIGNQMWHFVRQENGSYSIGLDGTTLWMDVTGENYSDGTNIRMYQGNGSYSQKFFIYYINGRFTLRAMYNSKVVDVENGGDNVHLWGDTAGDVGSIAYDARGLEILKLNMDGTKVNTCIGWEVPCYIRHKETGMLLTAVGDNALFQYPAYSEDQKWTVTRNEYGGHVIQSVVSGKVLDVAGASLDIWANIDLYEPNGSKAQTFFIIPQGYSTYWYIKPSYTNTLMSIDGTTGEIYSYAFGDTDTLRALQQFEFITDDHISADEVLRTSVKMGESFIAQLHSHESGKVLTDHGDTVSMDNNTRAENQFWSFVYDSETNAYKITGSSGKVLDTKDGGYKNNTKIVLAESNGALSQRYRFYDGEYGYIISPAHAQRLLDIATDGTTLQLYRSNIDSSRLFDLTVVSYNGQTPVDFGESFTSAIENIDSSLYVTEANKDPLVCTKTATKWKFTRKDNGAYTVTSAATGKALEVSGGYVSAGSNVKLYDANGTRAQDYFIYSTGSGYVLMSSKSVNVLDMDGSSKKLHIYGWGDSETSVAAHSFELEGAPLVKKLIIKTDSGLTEADSYVKNVPAGMTAAQIIRKFDNTGVVVWDADGNQVADDALCATGYTVNLMVGGRAADTLQIVVAGDVDGSGQVDVTDYMRIRSMLLGTFDLAGAYLQAGDVDRNGKIDTTDYLQVRAYFLGTYELCLT